MMKINTEIYIYFISAIVILPNSINRIMKHTSIQNIISTEGRQLQEREIRQLFQRKIFPRFELIDLKMRDELIKREQFIFFLGILERWNKEVDDPKKQINECDYQRNQFIFSWLKWVAVQNEKYIDISLAKLYQWYSSCSRPDTRLFMRKQNAAKSRLEEWEIRNSYKSNLPLEIDNYKRRAIFDLLPENVVALGENKENQKVQQGQWMQKSVLSGPKAKKENNFMRGVREQREMGDFLTNYRKSKIYFYNNMAKEYYKNEFSRDKIKLSGSKSIKDRLNESQIIKRKNIETIKDYRIKTSLGFRPFMRNSNVMAKTAGSNFYNDKGKNDQKEKSEVNKSFEQTKGHNITPTNIDGIGLMVNPFDLRLKKKKN